MIEDLAGGRGWPFAGTVIDLAGASYEEREYLVAGHATRYRFSDDDTYRYDGRWRVEPAATRPYCTRVLVRRPTDPTRFNGTILVHWNNVSAGFEGVAELAAGLVEDGFAQVCVSVQRVGLHGLPHGNPIGLTQWDPDRYGSLSIEDDDLSYDVFTSAARLARELTGLDGKLVAVGNSQSAIRLASYYNAIQPLAGCFDGFLLEVWRGAGAVIDSTDSNVDLFDFGEMTDVVRVLRNAHRLRDDLDASVLLLNSETETRSYTPARQPDTDTFRLWEVAGAAHASTDQWEQRAATARRDFGGESPSPFVPSHDHNTVSLDSVRDAAMWNLHRWIHRSTPPPTQLPIDVVGDPPEIVRDEHGNATGGFRHPDMEVPTARHTGERQYPSDMYGRSIPFPPTTLAALYHSPETYRARFDAAADAAVQAGVLLPRGARRLHERNLAFQW